MYFMNTTVNLFKKKLMNKKPLNRVFLHIVPKKKMVLLNIFCGIVQDRLLAAGWSASQK